MLRSKCFRRFRRFGLLDDSGSASLEFITAGLILLVPMVYLILSVSAIQAASLSVEGASRQAARVFVQGKSLKDARVSAQLAVEFALSDYGLDPDQVTVTISCTPHPSQCLTRRGFVTVTVSASVPLPLSPPALDMKAPLSVPLRATATQQVSRFWAGR
jgi:Flp pilus assembly protein TadG